MLCGYAQKCEGRRPKIPQIATSIAIDCFMSKPFKNHSLDAIEKCLGAGLTELFGEKTFVLIDQMEMNGALKEGLKLVMRAYPDQRASLPDIQIERP
jgi:hypothetical protein